VCAFSIPGTPISKARARFRNTGYGGVQVYTPTGAASAQETMAWEMKAALRTLSSEPTRETAFGVRAAFYDPTLQRRDIDNLLKLVCDAATSVIWVDDNQVTEIHAVLSRGADEGRTDVLIYTNGPMTTRTARCKLCKSVFRTYPSWLYKEYCTRACQVAGDLTGEHIPCRHCGKVVYRAPHRIRDARSNYCSNECRDRSGSRETQCPHCHKTFRIASTRRVAKHEFCTRECAIAFFRATPVKIRVRDCDRCGAPVSRKAYKHCRACRMELNPSPTSNYWTRTP
jgi:Holliday junction resolvase RusA-like endonuclease